MAHRTGDAGVAAKHLNGVFQRIRSLAAVQNGRQYSDRALLARFVEAGDEAAFTVLVERHGSMLLGLCRRVLGHADDAEDACQATFLVLARKAASLHQAASRRRRLILGGWLHGVAYRIAVNLRRQRARRLRRERMTRERMPTPRMTPPPSRDTDGDVTWRELRTVLDEELQRLPARYRQPLILCYLDGKTRDEAAQELGASAGALHGLLERGRTLLRQRLTRRGLTLSAALIASALTATAVKAALPPALVVASTKSALALASGQPLAHGAIAPHILALAQEALKLMFITKLKIGTALVVCGGLLIALVAGWAESVSRAQDVRYEAAKALVVRQAKAESTKAESDADFIRRVSKDLRGVEPTPAEVHFFTASNDPNRRQKVIDLFIQERQAKQTVQMQDERISVVLERRATQAGWLRTYYYHVKQPPRVSAIQGSFYKELLAAKDKKEVAAITQNYLEQLLKLVADHPKNDDIADAMLQISLVYRSQGKSVEADAWRQKLREVHPSSPAAKTAQDTSPDALRYWAIESPDVEVEFRLPIRVEKEAGEKKDEKKQ